MLDIDQDGDTDIVFGDDDCAGPGQEPGGIQRGFIHVMLNTNGTGTFTDQPITIDSFSSGSWMGLDFGDLNCDGHIDIFGSNFGDYGNDLLGNPYFPDLLGARSTRWFLGSGGGSFTDPAAGSHVSAFGWGNGVFDYDNDGDQDVVYHGGIDFNFWYWVKPRCGVAESELQRGFCRRYRCHRQRPECAFHRPCASIGARPGIRRPGPQRLRRRGHGLWFECAGTAAP